MSNESKSVLDKILAAFAKMTREEQERLCYVAEGIAIATENTEHPAE